MKRETFKTQNVKNKQLGASLVEFSLLVALVAFVSFGAVQRFGTSVNNAFDKQSVQIATGSGNLTCTPGQPAYPRCLAW